MKKYFYSLFLTAAIFASCTSSKNAPKTSEDKALLSVLKKFEKDPSNTELKNTITSLYNEAAKSHLDKIEIYNTLTEVDKWIKIIKEYEALKNLSETISNSAAAKVIVTQTYISEIQNAKENGAEAYYNLGIAYLDKEDKES